MNTFYDVKISYEKVMGLWFKVVDWIAQRIAEKPIVPSCFSDNTDDILVSRTVSASVLDLFGTATVWNTTGQYRYLLKEPPPWPALSAPP